jgi:CBS domain-containing protein
MLVSEVMQKDLDYLTPSMSVKEALKVLIYKEHRGLAVIMPRSKKLLGFLTDQDILSRCFPLMEEYMENIVQARDYTAMEKKLKDIMRLRVESVMFRNVTAITADEPVMKAEVIMKLKNISRLPVINKKMQYVGMIRKRDIFKALVSKYL